jgi:O-antigen biosynthesis protein
MPRLRLRHRPTIITRADRAQSARQWLLAARLYRKALDRNLDNPPIWVHYGHALKESGNLAEAERAYRAALSYGSGVADTQLQLGHVLKLQGKTEEAEAAYLRALALDVSLAAATHELADLGWTQEHLSAATEIAVGHPARKNRTPLRRQTARRRGSA